jgi:hypothetical protein
VLPTVRRAIADKGWALREAFEQMDKSNDGDSPLKLVNNLLATPTWNILCDRFCPDFAQFVGLLTPVELAYALESLQLKGLDSGDIKELIESADKNEDEWVFDRLYSVWRSRLVVCWRRRGARLSRLNADL